MNSTDIPIFKNIIDILLSLMKIRKGVEASELMKNVLLQLKFLELDKRHINVTPEIDEKID